MKLRLFDWLALGLSLSITALVAWQVYGASGGPELVCVTGPDGVWVYPLGADREITVCGPLGETRVVIRGEGAFVVDSPCRDRLCVSMGRVTRHGGWIACLPNRVLIRVEAAADDGLDATAY